MVRVEFIQGRARRLISFSFSFVFFLALLENGALPGPVAGSICAYSLGWYAHRNVKGGGMVVVG
jgi:hypothetical protein